MVGRAGSPLRAVHISRRGAHGVVCRDVEPELLVECLRKVSEGHPWLDSRGTQWVLEAFRTQGSRPTSPRPKVQLTPKESLIVLTGCPLIELT